jgi:hypothetical protein
MTAVVTELKQKSDEYFQGVGTTLDCNAGHMTVDTDHGVFPARRAVSCLVEPEEGDRVLLAGTLGGDLFVIAILERPDGKGVAIAMDGDCSVKVSHGKLDFAAEKGINLLSSEELNLTAADLSLRAARGGVFIDKLNYFGSRIAAHTNKIRLIGDSLETFIGRVAQRFKRSFRIIDEVDHVRSKTIDYRADANLSLHGQNTLIDADELVRLEGEQIHLG